MTTIKKFVYGIICFILLTILFVTIKSGVVQTALVGDGTIPILMYHHVVGDREEVNKITITKERFEEDLKYLREKGYTALLFNELIECRKGERKFPSKPIIITFDDGLADNYIHAYPLLKDYNIKATIFVIGSRMGIENYNQDTRYSYFSWGQAREMAESGWIEIQPHSYDLHHYKENSQHGHGALAMENESKTQHYDRFLKDTHQVVTLIKEELGLDSYVYAYPYGEYTSTNEKVLKDLGFKVTLTTHSVYINLSKDLYHLKRINVPSHKTLDMLGIH